MANVGDDGLQAPELDQPVLELQAGQQAVSQTQQTFGGTGGVIPVASGGTGAATAAGALSNLGAAPSNATYITQTASAGLSAEQNLAALATGYMKSTTATGVVTTQAVPIPVADGGTGSVLGTDALLSSTLINLNTTAWQDLYTVGAGKTLVCTRIVGRSASVNLAALGGAFALRDSGTTNVIFGTIGLTGLIDANKYVNISSAGDSGVSASQVVAATNKAQARTDTSFGSAATVIVDLFGYLF